MLSLLQCTAVVGRPTVENCLSGFNSSVFAYGQTGSGKTHTMIGELPEECDQLPPNVRREK
jgi:chromosomal replication initiation ATPase DnaA